MAGYELVHHGEGRWNGVAIASPRRADVGDVVTQLRRRPGARLGGPGAATSGRGGLRPVRRGAHGRARPCGGIRVVSLYAPNGRVVGLAVLRGQARLVRAARALARRGDCRAPRRGRSCSGGDFNVAPTDEDVWDAGAVHGGTHVSEPERAAFARLLRLGARRTPTAPQPAEPGRFTWWDYRAGMFHKNHGHAHRPAAGDAAGRGSASSGAEIDREARKGPPIPSDHAPLSIDLDEPGKPFDPTGPARSSASRLGPADRRRRRGARLGDRVARDPADRAVRRSHLEEPLVGVDEFHLVAAIQPAELA